MDKFVLKSNYKPMGDQPQAIDSLANGVLDGDKEQVLLGVTGSGKTFTMANIIEKVNRPTLILAHNKTLAAQLCSEFKEFFPDSKEAAMKAVNAGVDMEMVSYTFVKELPELIKEGKVKKSAIDDAVRNILRIKFRLSKRTVR